jgi:hypothetical protein
LGSPLSPELYDVYMEEFTSALIHDCPLNSDIWYKVYADYLVLLKNYEYRDKVLHQLKKSAEKYGLILNTKKSAILCV